MTLGSFNTAAKISEATARLWSRVLREVPRSRLLLKSRALDDPGTRAGVLDVFEGLGVERERVELMARVPDGGAHLALYRRVDIALDPFPYNGTTTTCEALWMGVPVVTLMGDRHAARVGASLLRTVGMPELVAASEDAYVEAVRGLAVDGERLAALRSGLRARVRGSPLCDAERFTRGLEGAFRGMWREKMGQSGD